MRRQLSGLQGITDPPGARVTGGAVLALVLVTGGALLLRARPGVTRKVAPDPVPRSLHAAAAGLCASVLADSAVEHYRANFENPGMVSPLAVSALATLLGAQAAVGAGTRPALRRGVYGLAVATGLAGFGFHLYNLLRKPGGVCWQNLFYAAPVGAPAALGLGGALGLAADHVARATNVPARIAGAPAGRALCALVAAGLAGTIGEVSLLHFRGSFQNPFMWLPITLPPIAALLTAGSAIERPHAAGHRFTRAWLRLTAALGVGGVGFHAYGVSRAMGGWRNWSQNVLDGPPLPAPPSFSALAVAGLAALRLREREDV
jgi:hypothetical protein